MRKSLFGLAFPLLLAACSGGSDGSGPTSTVFAPPPVGMQLATTPVTLAAGAEQYLCWSVQVPQDGAISLVGFEPHVPTTGVHHFAIFTDPEPLTQAGPYDCTTMGLQWGLVAGGGVGTPGLEFPAGTAMNISAGTQLIFQLHLLNVTTATLDMPAAYVNLIGTTETSFQPVGLLIGGTTNIDIPPHGTDVGFSGSCTLTQPMPNIFAVFPHMHKLGTRITAGVQATSSSTPVMISDRTWDFSEQGVYPVTGSAAVGDQVNVSCYYDNPGATDVMFGLSTTDEMCVDVLYYYPATAPSTYCGLG